MATAKIFERLRKGRTELSQRELAAKLDMSLSSYQRTIDGTNPLTLDIIQRAAKFFKVPEDVLMGRIPLYDEPQTMEESFKDTSTISEPRTRRVLSVPEKQSVSIMVHLDGMPDTLNKWIKTLSQINAAL